MKACCPKCDALCTVTPGKIIDGRRCEYNTTTHPRPVCSRCRSFVNFEARGQLDAGTWVCALCGLIGAVDVDHTTGPSCKGGTIR
jgi:hypothetical protein